MQLWNVATQKPLGPPLTATIGAIASVAISPNGTMLAAGGDAGRVQLWNVATQKPLGPPLTANAGPVYSVAFSPDGTVLASAWPGWHGAAVDVVTRAEIGLPLTGDTGPVYSVAWSGPASAEPNGPCMRRASPTRTAASKAVRSQATISPAGWRVKSA